MNFIHTNLILGIAFSIFITGFLFPEYNYNIQVYGHVWIISVTGGPIEIQPDENHWGKKILIW